MGLKFDKIYESVVSRYTVGGYLPGDIVKFRPDYKSCDCYKAMHTVMKQELDELVKSGLNIKVIQVGDKLSGASAGNQHKTADNVVITVAGDQGGGRYYGSVAVKPEMIDIADANNPNPDVPDQFYRDDEKYLNGKAEEYVTDMQNITRLTDKGNKKNTPTNLKLAGESLFMKNSDNDKLAMIYEQFSEKDQLITNVRHAQKTGNPSALKIAKINLQTWAKQNNGMQDPEVLEFIDPQPQAQPPAVAPAQAPTTTAIAPTQASAAQVPTPKPAPPPTPAVAPAQAPTPTQVPAAAPVASTMDPTQMSKIISAIKQEGRLNTSMIQRVLRLSKPDALNVFPQIAAKLNMPMPQNPDVGVTVNKPSPPPQQPIAGESAMINKDNSNLSNILTEMYQ